MVMYRIMNKAKRVAILHELKYHHQIRKGSITSQRSAQNLLDCADAYLSQYYFLRDESQDNFSDDVILEFAAQGISRVWRWWYGCSRCEQKSNIDRIEELLRFSRERIPLFGCSSWPLKLRIPVFFTHSDCGFSFSSLFLANMTYRRIQTLLGHVVR